jgi:fatty-acyl-CoA synthase
MAWGFLTHVYSSGSDMVLPLHLQPEAIINILQKEKNHKANGVPTSGLGFITQ